MAKMLVEIISENITTRKKYPVIGNKIIINAGTKGRGNAAYEPTFSRESILFYRTGIGPFKPFLRQKVHLMKDADRCVDYRFLRTDGRSIAEVNIPTMTREGIRRYMQEAVIKAAGSISNKLQVPGMLYAAIFLSAAVSFMTLLVASGRLKI